MHGDRGNWPIYRSVARPRKKFRKELVERCRARIADGFYDSPEDLERILSPRLLDTILADLNGCPVGDGNAYRDLTAEFLGRCLGDVIDESLVKMEFPCHGGRGDIELPLRLEALHELPLWRLWAERYRATSVIVEVKNEAKKAATSAVQQIDSYLNLAGRGGLGMLVSRSGFTSDAIKQLSQIAKQGHKLILPIRHTDLGQLTKARRKGPRAVMEYVRRRQTLLLQD